MTSSSSADDRETLQPSPVRHMARRGKPLDRTAREAGPSTPVRKRQGSPSDDTAVKRPSPLRTPTPLPVAGLLEDPFKAPSPDSDSSTPRAPRSSPFSNDYVPTEQTQEETRKRFGKPGGTKWDKRMREIEGAKVGRTWRKDEAPFEFWLEFWATVLGWSARERQSFRQMHGSRWRGHGYDIDDPEFKYHLRAYLLSRGDVINGRRDTTILDDELRDALQARDRSRLEHLHVPTHHAILLQNIHNVQRIRGWELDKASTDSQVSNRSHISETPSAIPRPDVYDQHHDEEQRQRGIQTIRDADEPIKPAVSAMLLDLMHWTCSGRVFIDSHHYHCLVDTKGRPLRFKDVVDWTIKVADAARVAAKWMKPYHPPKALDEIKRTAPQAWDHINDCEVKPLVKDPKVLEPTPRSSDRHRVRVEAGNRLRWLSLDETYLLRRDPSPEGKGYIVVDYEAELSAIDDYLRLDLPSEAEAYFPPYEWAKLTGLAACSITRTHRAALDAERDLVLYEQDEPLAKKESRKRKQAKASFAEISLMDTLSFLTDHDDLFQRACGYDYPSYISEMVSHARQLLLLSIGSTLPGFVSVGAHALVAAARLEFALDHFPYIPDLSSFLSTIPLKLTHGFCVSTFQMHQIERWAIEKTEECWIEATDRWCIRFCQRDTETGTSCAVLSKQSRVGGHWRDDFTWEVSLIDCLSDLKKYVQSNQTVLVVYTSACWVHTSCKTNLDKAGATSR